MAALDPLSVMAGEFDKCGAKKRQYPFTPCEQPAGWGTDHPGIGVCRFHGGAMQSHNVHADAIRANWVQDEARVLLHRENLVPVDDPLRELQMLAAEVTRIKTILADKVEELSGWSYSDLTQTEQVRAVVMAYERALDRCNTVLSGMVRLGIEERLARVSQAQAAILIRVVEAVLESREMALPQDKRQLGRAIVAREVEAVVAADPAANGAAVPS